MTELGQYMLVTGHSETGCVELLGTFHRGLSFFYFFSITFALYSTYEGCRYEKENFGRIPHHLKREPCT